MTTRRSTSGYVFKRNGAAVSWNSVLQRTVAHSTSDAEYRALSDANRECQYLRKIELILNLSSSTDLTVLFEDNKGAQKWTDNPTNHSKTKHIEICYHSVREQVNKTIKVVYCKTAEMLADPFTKALAAPLFSKLYRRIFGSKDLKTDSNSNLISGAESPENDNSSEQGGC